MAMENQENQIEMKMDRQLIDYLPEILRDYREFKAIAAAQQPEFELVWQAVDSLLAEQFVHTATGLGLARWEQMLGISPKASDSPADRCFRILSRLNDKLPYTWRALKAKLDAIAGEDYNISWQDYEIDLEVGAALLAEDKLTQLRQLVEAYAPANMLVAVSAAEVSGLPGWALLVCTGEEIREESHAEIF